MHKITFQPNGKTVEAKEGQSILRVAGSHGIHINATCGGKGNCGKCRVILKEGRVHSKESGFLTEKEHSQGVRLACRSFPETDLVVEIPLSSQMRRGSKIAAGSKIEEMQKSVQRTCEGEFKPITKKIFLRLPPPNLDDNISDTERIKRELLKRGHAAAEIRFNLHILRKMGAALRAKDWAVTLTLLTMGNVIEVMDVQPGDALKPRYGAAVDVGTTSLVVYLVNIHTGKIEDIASSYNPQVRCGEDVISRMIYASEKNGLDELQKLAVGAVNDLLISMAKKRGIEPDTIDTIIVSGNTSMTHLFYGIDPSHIREEPYIPTATFFPLMRTHALGLGINDFGVIYAMPCVASYVGGDITSGILASKLYKKPELTLFIDIGTNGEIVLGNSDWMVAAACSAGPAFEGGGVKFGMRAMDGAIEKVSIDPATFEIKVAVIGNCPPLGSRAPIGICGSGMIDAVAEMFLTGRHRPAREDKHGRRKRPGEGRRGRPRVRAHPGRGIRLRQGHLAHRARHRQYRPDQGSNLRRFLHPAKRSRLHLRGRGKGIYRRRVRKLPGCRARHNYRAFAGHAAREVRVPGQHVHNGRVHGASVQDAPEGRGRHSQEDDIPGTSVSRSFMDEYVSSLFLPHTHADQFPTVKKLKESIKK